MTTRTKQKTKQNRLSRAAFEAAKDLREEWVHIKELGGDVLLRAISMEALFEIREKNARAEEDDQEFGMLLVSRCLIDPDTNEPMFSFGEIGNIKRKSIGAVMQLIDAVNDINGLSEEAKKVADAALSRTANGASPSPSQKG